MRYNESISVTSSDKGCLKTNCGNCEVLVRLRWSRCYDITVDGVGLPYHDKVKNPGTTFNNTLTCTETVVDKSNKGQV